MNCATITPDERYAYDRERSHDRRTSRGLASCLRGESEEYYDFEAEGKEIHIFYIHVFIHVFINCPTYYTLIWHMLNIHSESVIGAFLNHFQHLIPLSSYD